MHLSFNEAKFNKQTYLPGCRTPAAGSPTRAQPPPWAEPRWICRWLWWESSSAAKRQTTGRVLGSPLRSWFSVQTQLLHVPHHVSVLLVVEVESRQDGFEFVEDLVVPRHVRGQDAPAGQADWSLTLTFRRRGKTDNSGRGMISLDDSLPDPFVLVHGKISEDVALCLESGKSSVYSPLLVEFKFRSFLRCACFLPSPVSQRPRHSGGSPAERCRCSGEPAQSGHWSEKRILTMVRVFKMFKVCPI